MPRITLYVTPGSERFWAWPRTPGGSELVEGDRPEDGVVQDDGTYRKRRVDSAGAYAIPVLALSILVGGGTGAACDEAVARVLGGRPLGLGRAASGLDRGSIERDRVVELGREGEIGCVAGARSRPEGLEGALEGLARTVALAGQGERLALIELIGRQLARGRNRRWLRCRVGGNGLGERGLAGAAGAANTRSR